MRRVPLLLALLGCGYRSEDFERHYPEVACERAERCASWSTLDLEPGQCLADRELDFLWFFGPESSFDPTRAHECLNDLATASCDDGPWPFDFESCQTVY